MELSYEELEALISYISIGKKYIFLEDDAAFINVEFPNNCIRQRAELVYKQTYNKAITEGLLPVKEFETLLKTKGILTIEDEEKLQMLKNKLKAQEVLLSKTLKVKANQDRIKKVISSLKEEILAQEKLILEEYNSLEAKLKQELSETLLLKDVYSFWHNSFDRELPYFYLVEYLKALEEISNDLSVKLGLDFIFSFKVDVFSICKKR